MGSGLALEKAGYADTCLEFEKPPLKGKPHSVFQLLVFTIPCTFSSLYLSQLQLNSNYFCAYLMSTPQYCKSQEEAHNSTQAPLYFSCLAHSRCSINIHEGRNEWVCLGKWKEGVHRGDSSVVLLSWNTFSAAHTNPLFSDQFITYLCQVSSPQLTMHNAI